MDIRALTPALAVSPQINPEDCAAIAAAGYKTLINNRPCGEIPPSHRADVMAQAAKDAGLAYIVEPLHHHAMTLETAHRQRDAIAAAKGPVLAYCASGTRCTMVWALGEAGSRPTQEIIETAAQHGYDLSMMRHQIETLAQG